MSTRMADPSCPLTVGMARRLARCDAQAQDPDEAERSVDWALIRLRISEPPAPIGQGDAALFRATIKRAVVDGFRAEYGRRPERQAITRGVQATDPTILPWLAERIDLARSAHTGDALRVDQLDAALIPSDMAMLRAAGRERCAELVGTLEATDLAWLRVLGVLLPGVASVLDGDRVVALRRLAAGHRADIDALKVDVAARWVLPDSSQAALFATDCRPISGWWRVLAAVAPPLAVKVGADDVAAFDDVAAATASMVPKRLIAAPRRPR